MTEKYIIVSLDDEKAKKLAEVISNDTSRKILDYLSEKEATESEISRNLSIPLSTVSYNVKNLIKNDLIEANEFKWSPKGREQDIFRVKRKYFIIAPAKDENFLLTEALKKIFPMSLIGLIIAVGIEYFTRETQTSIGIIQKSVSGVSEAEAAYVVPAQEILVQYSLHGIYFFIGFILALVSFLIFINIRKLTK